jgi:hypothetical protein
VGAHDRQATALANQQKKLPTAASFVSTLPPGLPLKFTNSLRLGL